MPAAAGIYMYICPQLRAYICIYARSYGHLYIYIPAAVEKVAYLLYILFSSGYIQQYTRLHLGFFRPRQKKSLGQGRALGPSALGHGPALGIFLPRTKKTSLSGLYRCI